MLNVTYKSQKLCPINPAQSFPQEQFMKWLSNLLEEQDNYNQIFSFSGKIRKITIISAYLDLWFFNEFQKEILKFYDSRARPELEVFCDYHANYQWVTEKYAAEYDKVCKRFKKYYSDISKLNFVSWGELFHTKCILIETNSGKSIAIGSGNFTNNGFSKNEELFLHLSEDSLSKKHKHLIKWLEEKYIPQLREKTVLLKWDRKRNESTLRELVLNGKIVFEAKIQDSLRFVLKLPDSVKNVPTNISPLLEAGLTDSISIDKLIELTKNQPLKKEKEPAGKSWKRLCIETCYGHWLAREYLEDFNKILKAKEAKKEPYYHGILQDIKNIKDSIKVTFLGECDKIENYIKDNFPNESWDLYQPILLSGERLLSQKFSDWLTRVEQKLENPDYVKKLSHGLLISPTPDFWSDANACEEFLESIGNTIQFISQRGGKMMNVPVSAILKQLGQIEPEEAAIDIVYRISDWLKQNGDTNIFAADFDEISDNIEFSEEEGADDE